MTIKGHKILAVIPARGGSRRIPNKNMKLFHGKPIIQYSIDTAMASDIFDEIIVSTDSQEIRDFVEKLGVKYQPRLSYMAQDEIGTQAVGASVLKLDAQMNKSRFDMVCIIYATAPMMTANDLARGMRALFDDPDCSYVYAAEEAPDNSGFAHAGQFYWCRSIPLLFGEELDGPSTKVIYIDPRRVCDINTPEDWERAEAMYLEAEKHGLL